MDILKENMDGDDGDWGLIQDIHKANRHLASSQSLQSLTAAMLRSVLPYFSELDIRSTVQLELYGWIRRVFTLASMEALYGPKNPFKNDPSLAEAFW